MQFGKPLKICLVILCLLGFLPTGLPQSNGATSFMKEIKLNQGYSTKVDDDDFEYLSQWKWCIQDKKNLYPRRTKRIGGGKVISFLMHRVIMKITDRYVIVDHKDHDTLNNQKVNLRVCSRSDNNSNVRSAKGSISKYLGVTWNKPNKKWIAAITKNYRRIHIGCFQSEKQAALAYNERAKEIHGEFANLNQV